MAAEEFICEECGTTHRSEDLAAVCAGVDRRMANDAMLGLASSMFLEGSRDGRKVLENIKKDRED